jgi:hypothetical protein
MTIYGNWSAYDELSDGVPLTEELAMRQLQELVRLRSYGVQFDAYLMDAFWFDPDGGYRTWRKPNWPDGPFRWLDACAEHGLVPGLWFTSNTLCHLTVAKAWEDSADVNGWGLCCFHGGFLADYLDVLDFWYAQGIRIFKLDFADFTAGPAEIREAIPVEEIRERNRIALHRGIVDFRQTHPQAIFMGFNGFEAKEYMDRTDRPLEAVLDLRWLEVFDTIYSGDPRPADVPTVPFWRSVDIYSDHTTRVLLHSGLPAGKIDNCGFMAGPTGTCYWRGKAMWKSMLVQTLARGGDLTVLYGDLSQFDEADAVWMANVQALFGPGQPSVPVGGIPGQEEAYGWLVGNRLCAVVNPTVVPTVLEIPAAEWHVVFRDEGFVPLLSGDKHSVELGPYQFVLLGVDGPDLGVQSDCVSAVRIPVNFTVIENYQSKLVVECPGGELLVIVRQRDSDGRLVRTYSGTSSASGAISIAARQGDYDLAISRYDDKVVWSGMSWAIGGVSTRKGVPARITVEVRDPQVKKIDLEIWDAKGQ